MICGLTAADILLPMTTWNSFLAICHSCPKYRSFFASNLMSQAWKDFTLSMKSILAFRISTLSSCQYNNGLLRDDFLQNYTWTRWICSSKHRGWWCHLHLLRKRCTVRFTTKGRQKFCGYWWILCGWYYAWQSFVQSNGQVEGHCAPSDPEWDHGLLGIQEESELKLGSSRDLLFIARWLWVLPLPSPICNFWAYLNFFPPALNDKSTPSQ